MSLTSLPMSNGVVDILGDEDMSSPDSFEDYNGENGSSFGDPKKKKGPAPRQQEELCLVCGDRASGYHYNALTCEGCKGFFRRSITKNAVYQCKYGNNCEIDMYMRRKCQECRLKKCLSVGMRPECVVPEYQCAIKRESKRAQKDKDKPNSTTKDHSNHHSPTSGGGHHPLSNTSHLLTSSNTGLTMNHHHLIEKDEKPSTTSLNMINSHLGINNCSSNNSHSNNHQQTNLDNNHNHVNGSLGPGSMNTSIMSHNGKGAMNGNLNNTMNHNGMNNHVVNNHSSHFVGPTNGLSSLTNGHSGSVNNTMISVHSGSHMNGVKPLTQNQEDMIKKLVYFQEEFESPQEEDVKKITPFPLGESEEDSLKRFQHVTEMTILTVQLIVEFSKRVPGFDTLLREDQITLLKACSSEVMMLRCSRKYDIKTDSIVYANNQPYTRENYRSASIGDFADALFNFCRSMCVLKVDNAEYSLLTAIIIFSERPQLVEPRKVEKIQEYYLETLRAYVENNRSPHKCKFAKLLAVLIELRSLGNTNSEVCFSLKVQNKRLPPFLAEIWDIQE